MKSVAFIKTALRAVIVCSLIFITASFAAADVNLQEAGQPFIGTWDSRR